MATVNYKCPNCGGPLKYNPDKQMFSCEYCLSDFSEQKVQELYAQREAAESRAEKAEKQAEQKAQSQQGSAENADEASEEAVVYTCPSCGAEVITTASTAATTCFYCQNPVVLGGRLSGEYKPDRIIPFALSKDKAIEKFLEMCKRKWFLPKDFAGKNQFDKFQGVYFPYWYIDTKMQAHMIARGEKVRTWRSGNKRFTETKIYEVIRDGNLDINNLFERALKSEDREMLQCVHPFDLSQARSFSMSYLSGFQAEKRDIERAELEGEVEGLLSAYGQQLLTDTVTGYSSVVTKEYGDDTVAQRWSYTLLPVWVVTYKYKNKIYPFAINGQTGKTYGMLPTSKGKLAILFAILSAALMLLGFAGGLLLL